MRVKIEELKGKVKVPGDKSISHRAVLLGAICNGNMRIENLLESEDVKATLRLIKALGIEYEKVGKAYYIKGKGLNGLKEPENVIDAGNSGTTIRIGSGVLAAQPFFSVITGDSSLIKRPMKRIIIPLSKMGATIRGRENNSYPPLAILGAKKIKGIKYKLPVPSAQVKSSILFAGLFARQKTIIIEPVKSRNHTELMFQYLGINLDLEKDKIILNNKRKEIKPKEIYVPGDFSSASFFIAGALLKEGSKITIPDVGLNPTRTGLLKVLERMGAKIIIKNKRILNNEPVGTIIVEYSKLKGTEVKPEEIPLMIDEIPVLSVIAIKAEGKTIIRGAEELKYKESNRLKAIVENLTHLGVEVKELKDGLEISYTKKIKENANLKSYNDHRIAMAFLIASILTRRGVKIDSIDSIKISYPGFISDLKKVTKVKIDEK